MLILDPRRPQVPLGQVKDLPSAAPPLGTLGFCSPSLSLLPCESFLCHSFSLLSVSPSAETPLGLNSVFSSCFRCLLLLSLVFPIAHSQEQDVAGLICSARPGQRWLLWMGRPWVGRPPPSLTSADGSAES